jgi:hypothetical protein
MKTAKEMIFEVMIMSGGFYSFAARAVLRGFNYRDYSHSEHAIRICGITATVEEYQEWAKNQN